MTILVGYAPDERGKAGLQLASMLARSADVDLVVACVLPVPWVPGMARIDAEYREELERTADRALEQAEAYLAPGVRASFVRHAARSAPAGLLELASKREANLIVLGSSSQGAFGHIALGSVTDRLVHSSPVSVALATRGFRTSPDARVTRVTAAYGGTSSAQQLVVAAASVAAEVGASMRIASLAVWSLPAYTTRLGTDSEDLVFEAWKEEVTQAARAALAQVEGLATAPRDVEMVIGRGQSWGEALDDLAWGEGDVLVMGSSELGPVAQVFLGSRATKILRSSPVPVVVVPRSRAEELAEKATRS
jgi:nucleotide-binding universal stress UspA family protein